MGYQSQSQSKNAAIKRQELDTIINGNFRIQGFEQLPDLSFFQILGNSDYWNEDNLYTLNPTGDFLSSFEASGIPYVFLLISDGCTIRIYMGCPKILRESLMATLKSIYPGIRMECVEIDPFPEAAYQYGGFFTGLPTHKKTDSKAVPQLDNIIRAMKNRPFSYILAAVGIQKFLLSAAESCLLSEMDSVFSLISQTASGGQQGNISITKQDSASKNYYSTLEALLSTIQKGMSEGMWRVNGYYSAPTVADSKSLENIIRATFSGVESDPEPFRVIPYNSIQQVIFNHLLITQLADSRNIHPLGLWKNTLEQDVYLYIYQFQTIMTSGQLGVLSQLPIKETAGYFVDHYVEYDQAMRHSFDSTKEVFLGSIDDGSFGPNQNRNNSYFMNLDDFTRHALIIGITGGGKTNTSKSILQELWLKHKIPFLVIESAKREYWELRNIKGFEDLRVFTLGGESKKCSVGFRINPFEVPSGISIQTHIDYLLSAFKAAFEMVPPMPYILEQSLYRVYEDSGWDIVENSNQFGSEYPTLEDLYYTVEQIINELGYKDEMQSNVKAALEARITSLMIGGKGAMLNIKKSIPMNELLSQPTVLELEDIGDDESKAFVIGILMIHLYEYRKSIYKNSRQTEHILMIEEAHRLLKNIDGGTSGTQASSVNFFCNMLAEIRTYGQGILIADQIPSKLAIDTIKNTNLKIVHRTVAAEDRELIGNAMNMTGDQIEHLSTLRRGFAAVYAEGDNRPKLIKFPLIKAEYSLSRSEVIQECQEKSRILLEPSKESQALTQACKWCGQRCRYSEINNHIKQNLNTAKIIQIFYNKNFNPEALTVFIKSKIHQRIQPMTFDDEICLISQTLENDTSLSPNQSKKILMNYLKYRKEY